MTANPMREIASTGQLSSPTRRKLQVRFGPAVAERRLLGARLVSRDRKSALTGGKWGGFCRSAVGTKRLTLTTRLDRPSV